MGVAFGRLIFDDNTLGYAFLKNYCKENAIEISDYPEDSLILTSGIPRLKVMNSAGLEIKGVESSIAGSDSDGFEITIVGISYPFYEEEFPHHVQAYNDLFNKGEQQ